MNPNITVARKSNSNLVLNSVAKLARKQVYVGITEDTSRGRKATLLNMAGKATGKKKARLEGAAKEDITNAELMFILSKGSPIRGIPATPIIEPAIVAAGNKEAITAELAGAAKATLDGDAAGATRLLKRAGMAGQRASQKWFTDPRNGWPANAPSTIAAKGSDRRNINTAALRQAITNVVEEG